MTCRYYARAILAVSLYMSIQWEKSGRRFEVAEHVGDKNDQRGKLPPKKAKVKWWSWFVVAFVVLVAAVAVVVAATSEDMTISRPSSNFAISRNSGPQIPAVKKFGMPQIPSRELTYPTFGKGKSSSNRPWALVSSRVCPRLRIA